MIGFMQRFSMFTILVIIQVLILNHVHIMGYATPSLFIYYILVLNSDASRISVLLQAFLIGLIVDIFGNTPGLNAAAITLMALVRPPLLRARTSRNLSEDYEPGIRMLGFSSFLRYASYETFVFVFAQQTLVSFSLFQGKEFILRIITNTIMTVLFIMCADTLRKAK